MLTCPVCREVLHLSGGVIVRHGYSAHGSFVVCSGSGTPISCVLDCCG